MTPSLHPVASKSLSGLQATTYTVLPWPLKVLSLFPEIRLKTMAVLSLDDVAMYCPSGDHELLRTYASWSLNFHFAVLDLRSHTTQVESWEEVRKRSSWVGFQDKLDTPAVWPPNVKSGTPLSKSQKITRPS